jgi:hypothetical protein
LLIGPNVQHTYTIIDNDGAAAAREAYLLDALFTNWRAPKRRLDVRI